MGNTLEKKVPMKRRIGYMRIKEIKGLMKIEVIPISKEEAMRLLRGESIASQGKSGAQVEKK